MQLITGVLCRNIGVFSLAVSLLLALSFPADLSGINEHSHVELGTADDGHAADGSVVEDSFCHGKVFCAGALFVSVRPRLLPVFGKSRKSLNPYDLNFSSAHLGLDPPPPRLS